MTWRNDLDRATATLEEMVPALLLGMTSTTFLGLLFLNKNPHAALHLTPRDGRFDYGVIVPILLFLLLALINVSRKNMVAVACILLTIPLLIGCQFIYMRRPKIPVGIGRRGFF